MTTTDTDTHDPGPPGWVHDFDDYSTWLDQAIDDTGGVPENGALIVQLDRDELDASVKGLLVPNQRIHLPDDEDLFLDVELVVDMDMNQTKYHYDLHLGEVCVARLDKHPGHEKLLGMLTHLHTGPKGKKISGAGEYNLEQATDWLLDFYRTEWRAPRWWRLRGR